MVKPNIFKKTKNILPTFEKLSFRDVSFRYKDELPEVLQHISFELNKGETIGIVGKTGSGKSTLVQLAVRQMDPTSGQILYNDQALADVNLEEFRSHIAVVPQDVFLFSDSIRNNILFGTKSNDISEEELIQVTKDAHVYHNIADFPEQFETILGERGVNLSGGQKQRVSIARALIRKPKFLILDDCLSAVDTETEEIILRNLKRYTQEHETTTMIVSHRISSLRNADRILVLENGQVIESGSHDELLTLGGHYKSMHDRQLLELENNKSL